MSARRLDILVPHFDETPEIMEPLLDSVKMQRGIDLSQVGVIIAFDGPDATELPLDEWRERYPFAIEDVHPEKGGVSHTRNAALDESTAEVVTFVDADDCYMDNRGLFLVMREMDAEPNPKEMEMLGVPRDKWEPGFDFLVSDFIEESKDPKTGNINYIPHVNNYTFVHSQFARRQWLVDNNLRFNDDLLTHEDSYWVILCRETVKPYRGKYNSFPFMLWCWRDNSICRGDKLYIQKTFDRMLKSNSVLVDELLRRGMNDKAIQYAVAMIEETFFTLNKKSWRDTNNKEYRDNVLECFKAYYGRHRDLWHSMPEQEKMVIAQSVRGRCLMEGDLLEAPITIRQWLVRLGLEDESYISDSLTYV